MSTLLLAHAGHWLVQVAYFLPVVGFLGWLGWVTLKERRAQESNGDGDERQ
jgi:hypothetical protein